MDDSSNTPALVRALRDGELLDASPPEAPAWMLQNQSVTLPFDSAALLVEESYRHYFQTNTKTLPWLLEDASDVSYGLGEPCGLGSREYACDRCRRLHVAAVAIRRVVDWFCYDFRGPCVLRLDWLGREHPLGSILYPGRVPFIHPELIRAPQASGLWLPDTIESFWQSNRCSPNVLSAAS